MGYMVLILARLRDVRAEMTSFLESENVESATQTIVLPVSEFGKCRRNKREFYYQGHLYDILKTTSLPAGQIAVTAIHDAREQDMLDHLGLCLRADTRGDQKHTTASFLHKLLVQPYILPYETHLCFPGQAFKKNHSFHFKDHYSVFHPFPVAPPPRRV